MKRGQITIFIIIAILIIAGIFLFFIFKGNLQQKEVVNLEIAPIQTKVFSKII